MPPRPGNKACARDRAARSQYQRHFRTRCILWRSPWESTQVDELERAAKSALTMIWQCQQNGEGGNSGAFGQSLQLSAGYVPGLLAGHEPTQVSLFRHNESIRVPLGVFPGIAGPSCKDRRLPPQRKAPPGATTRVYKELASVSRGEGETAIHIMRVPCPFLNPPRLPSLMILC